MRRRIYCVASALCLPLCVVGLSSLSACQTQPQSDDLTRRVFDGVDRFKHLFGEFYLENQRWPRNVDELAAVNARLTKPVDPRFLRQSKMMFQTNEDGTLVVTVTQYSPEVRLKLRPPDADGNMTLEFLPSRPF